MPYLEGSLPFSGSSPQAAHASRAGAQDAAPRALSQTVRYLRLLKDHPDGLTDAEAAKLLNLERSSVNARRKPLEKAGLVYADGFRPGPTGKVLNCIWKAR
jgi:hypothetical protein